MSKEAKKKTERRKVRLDAGSFLPQTQLRAALRAASIAIGVPYDPGAPDPEAMRLVRSVAARRRALSPGRVRPLRGRRSLPPRLVVRRRKDASTEILYVADGGTEVSTGYAADQRGHAEVFLALHASEHEDLMEGCVLPTSIRLEDVVAWWKALNEPRAQASARARDSKEAQFRFASRLVEHLDVTVLGEVDRESTLAYARVRGAMRGVTRRGVPGTVSAGTIRTELKFLTQLVTEYGAHFGFTWRPYVELPEAPRQPGHAFTRGEMARLLLAARGWQFDADGNPVTAMVLDPLGREFLVGDDGRLRFRQAGAADATARADDARPPGWLVARPVIDRAAREVLRPLRRLILLGLYTGSRHRVLRSLRWERNGRDGHVVADASGRFVRINRADVGKARTRKGCGPCGVPRRLAVHLGAWRTADARSGARTLVQRSDGRAYESHLDPLFRRLRDAAKVGAAWADPEDHRYPAEEGAGYNDARVHWLRHTCATWMLEGGASPLAVAEFLGMTVKTLFAVYGHVMRDGGGHARAVEALDRAARGRRP